MGRTMVMVCGVVVVVRSICVTVMVIVSVVAVAVVVAGTDGTGYMINDLASVRRRSEILTTLNADGRRDSEQQNNVSLGYKHNWFG